VTDYIERVTYDIGSISRTYFICHAKGHFSGVIVDKSEERGKKFEFMNSCVTVGLWDMRQNVTDDIENSIEFKIIWKKK
jgi:hypothetical protein